MFSDTVTYKVNGLQYALILWAIRNPQLSLPLLRHGGIQKILSEFGPPYFPIGVELSPKAMRTAKIILQQYLNDIHDLYIENFRTIPHFIALLTSLPEHFYELYSAREFVS
jgi:hypothetical protein